MSQAVFCTVSLSPTTRHPQKGIRSGTFIQECGELSERFLLSCLGDATCSVPLPLGLFVNVCLRDVPTPSLQLGITVFETIL